MTKRPLSPPRSPGRLWALLAVLLTALAASAGSALATNYYVDSGATCPGDGSSGAPYCSFLSVNSLDLAPGDKVMLARGATFDVSNPAHPPLILTDEDDGSSVAWNSVEPYGSGADPIITGVNADETKGIVGLDLDYWKFIEIEFTSAETAIDLLYTSLSHTGLRFDKLYYHDMIDAENWKGRGIEIETAGPNLALSATASASSTDTSYYCECRVNDLNTTIFSGWASGDATMPEWVQLDWGSAQTLDRVELYTTTGYVSRDFEVQYWDGSGWVTPSGWSVTSNTEHQLTFTVSPAVSTTKIRVTVTLGDAITGYARVDEIEVFNSASAPVPSASQWVLKDIQVTDNEFGPIGLYIAVDGIRSLKLETFQDILFMRNYTHDVRWTEAFRYSKNVKWISNRNERISWQALPFGTTDLHLWAVHDSTFVNSIFDYTYDTGANDETFGDLAYRLDQTRFRNNLIEDAAGPGVEWHAWRTVDDYGLDPAANYFTNQELSGNLWRNNGWDPTPGVPDIFEGSISVNHGGVGACSTIPTGSVTQNLYLEPGGFLNKNGCSTPSLTETNNLATSISYYAAHTWNDSSCPAAAYGAWASERWTGSAWVTLSTAETVNPRTDARCVQTVGATPWVNRFELFPNTGTGYRVARTWKAPFAGTIQIRSRALKGLTGSGDGVNVRVTKNGSTVIVAAVTLGASDQVGVVLNDSEVVAAGDMIRFEVDDRSNNTNDRISWSPAIAYTSVTCNGNIAPCASSASASSTYSFYCPCAVNDGNIADFTGWANSEALPQWVQLEWGSSQTVGRVELDTTTGYETSEFQIQYWDSGTSQWITPSGGSITGNTEKHVTVTFTAVSTTKVRVYVTYGKPVVDPNTGRVDELGVYAS